MLNRYFEFPLVLLIAIATAVVLAVFNWRGRKSRAAYCSRLGIAPTQRSRLRVYSLALALILFGLAAAGPRWGGAAQVATAAGSDVAIVLDVSRSMNAKDAMPDRISKARELAAQVVESLARQGGHRVAVIAFAAKPTLVAPLTYDLKFIRAALTDLDPTGLRFSADQPKSGTRIGEGLQAAVASLAHGRPGARMILLFSDGDDPVDDREYLQGAEAAVAAHVPVAVIGIGHDTMESNVPGRPNAKTRLRDVPLRDIAGRTGGRYFSVGSESLDADSLVRAMLMDRRHGEDSNMAIARAPGRPLPFLAAGLVMLIVGMTGLRWRAATASVAIAAMAAGPIDDWLRRGDKALVANRPEQALEYYTKTDGRAPDPGLVAFNQGVALAALSRHREAEEHFRWSLSDATGERRARALYNLGTSMIHRSGGRDRAALHMAIGSLDEALRNIPANDPLATQVQENISVARALIAQLPPEEPNAPAESGPDKSGENNRSGESPGTPKPDSGKANEQSKSGEAPRPTDQPSPGKGTLPPLADSDELSELSSDDLESHLKRAMQRIAAARKERMKAKESERVPSYPDW